MTQLEKVIKHINKYGHITVLEAMALYRITQLGRVIYDLKDTKDAMKAIPCPELGDGFVRYVPDFDQRLRNLIGHLINQIEGRDSSFKERRDAIRYLHHGTMKIADQRNIDHGRLTKGSYPKCPHVSLTVANVA